MAFVFPGRPLGPFFRSLPGGLSRRDSSHSREAALTEVKGRGTGGPKPARRALSGLFQAVAVDQSDGHASRRRWRDTAVANGLFEGFERRQLRHRVRTVVLQIDEQVDEAGSVGLLEQPVGDTGGLVLMNLGEYRTRQR